MLCISIYFMIRSSGPDVTTAEQDGKYIPKEVTTDTETPGGIRQDPVETLQQGPTEPLAVAPQQQTASEGQSSDQSEISEPASTPKKQLVAVRLVRNAISRVQRHPETATLKFLPKVELTPLPLPLSIFSLLIMTFSNNPLETQLVLQSSPTSSFPIPLYSLDPYQGGSVPSFGATTPSLVVSSSSEDLTKMVVNMDQEKQAVIATNTDHKPRRSDRLIEWHENTPAPSVGNQCVEEPPSGQISVEAEKDLALQTETHTIEEPIDDQGSVENDGALQIEPESIEEPTVDDTSVATEIDTDLQIEPEAVDTPTHLQTSVTAKSEDVLQYTTEIVETPTDAQASVAVKNEEVLQIEPEIIEEPTNGDSSVATETGNDYQFEPEVVDTSAYLQTSLAAKNEEVLQSTPETIETPTGGQSSEGAEDDKATQTEPKVIKTATDGQVSHDPEDQVKPCAGHHRQEITKACFYYGISDEQKNSETFQLGSRTVELSVGRKVSPEEEEDKENEELFKKLEKSLDNFVSRLRIAVVNPRTLPKEDVRSARNSKTRRLLRSCLGRFRSQILERSNAHRVRTLRQKLTKTICKRYQSLTPLQAGNDSDVDANGGMVGLEVDDGEQVTEEVGHAGFMEEDEDMVNPEDEDVEVDEVMIGSDVEAEMDERPDGPNPDGDGGIVAGEPMRLEEDNPKVQAKRASNQSQLATINRQSLKCNLRNRRAQIARRQAPTQQASSGKMASGSISALAQPSQQHSALVSTSETRDAGISMPQGVVRNTTSANSDADLREARLGKKAERKSVPEEVESLRPSPGATVTDVGRTPVLTLSISPPTSSPPSTSSQKGMMTEGGDTSESDQSITTLTSTPPSTASSTPLRSPLSGNMASAIESPAQGSAGVVADAPKKQTRKRSGDILDDSRNDETSGDQLQQEELNQSNQSVPGSGSPTVSAARKVLLAKSAKRKVHRGDTEASKAKDGQKEPASATSPSPKPDPAESSKKARSGPKNDAGSEEKVAPLSDIPDDRGRKFFFLIQRHEERMLILGIAELDYTSQILEVAGDSWVDSGFDKSDDDDDDHDDHEDNLDAIS